MIPAFVIGLLVGYGEGKRRGLATRSNREWVSGFVDGLLACRKYGPPDRKWEPTG